MAALLTGVYCLGLEMCAYNWDLKAKAGKAAAVAKGQIPPPPPVERSQPPQPRPVPSPRNNASALNNAPLPLLIEFPAVDDRIAAGGQAGASRRSGRVGKPWRFSVCGRRCRISSADDDDGGFFFRSLHDTLALLG